MQNGIPEFQRKVYWDNIIFKLYKQTTDLNNGVFLIDNIFSTEWFTKI
jgi:hypothetical protein